MALKKKYACDLLLCADRINRVQKTVVVYARRWMDGWWGVVSRHSAFIVLYAGLIRHNTTFAVDGVHSLDTVPSSLNRM